MKSDRWLWFGLGSLGLGLFLSMVPGVFTIDEDNYLMTLVSLRQGRVTVPGTDGLTPSRELIWFEPTGRSRKVTSTPVASTAPPLYGVIAYPFSFLGWRGLVSLNILSLCGVVALVFFFARRHAQHALTPWIAAAACAFGAYLIEYAQGMWPHLLSTLLCTGSFVLAARARDGDALPWAPAAGILAGLALGVRYPNALYVGGTGLGLLVFCRQRLVASAAFGGAAALPLTASALINHRRIGSFNPISKGGSYISVGKPVGRSRLVETLHVLWVRLFDFSARPAPTGHFGRAHPWLRPHPETGVYVMGSAVKKAWLQSAPWILIPLVGVLAAWARTASPPPASRRSRTKPADAVSAASPASRDRHLRAIGLVIWPFVVAIAAFGFERVDGLCYNQRYFIDLIPLAATALSWTLERRVVPSPRPLLFGALVGAGLAALVLVPDPQHELRQIGLMKLPILLAGTGLVLWLLRHPGPRRAFALLTVVGGGLGWGLTVHVGDDLPPSREMRESSYYQAAALDAVIPDRSALFAHWGMKDPLGPLQLDRDLVIADPFWDGGETAPRLVGELLEDGRRVFVIASNFPPPLLRRMAVGRRLSQPMKVPLQVPGQDDQPPLVLFEIRAPGGEDAPPRAAR